MTRHLLGNCSGALAVRLVSDLVLSYVSIVCTFRGASTLIPGGMRSRVHGHRRTFRSGCKCISTLQTALLI